MVTQSTDTNPEVEKIQIMYLRRTSLSKKFEIMASLTSFVVGLSKNAIRNANKGLAKKELDLLFVKYNYGEECEKRLRQMLGL